MAAVPDVVATEAVAAAAATKPEYARLKSDGWAQVPSICSSAVGLLGDDCTESVLDHSNQSAPFSKHISRTTATMNAMQSGGSAPKREIHEFKQF